MHYTGMASMNVHGHMHHDLFWVLAATLIAPVATTVALWCASRLDGLPAIMSASLLMGAAVSLMHYTGMVGMHVEQAEHAPHSSPDGATSHDLLLPLVVGLFVLMLICSLFLLLGESDDRPSPREQAAHGAPEQRVHAGREPYRPRYARDDAPAEDFWSPRR